MTISFGIWLRLVAMLLLASLVSPRLGLASDLPLAKTQYVDPKGFFRIVPPDGWRVEEFPGDSRGKVAFFAPTRGTDLRVLVNSVDFSTMDELVAFCRNVEKRIGLNTHIERTMFGGIPAVRRTFTFKGSRLAYVDFLVGRVDHNLAYSSPASDFSRYEDVVRASMETYEPVLRGLTSAEAKQQVIDKKIRLAELMLERRNYELAVQFAEEGLEMDPENSILRELRARAEAGNE